MAGIFPTGGVDATSTQNALTTPLLNTNTTAKFYAGKCRVSLDPYAQNALISEVLAVCKAAGVAYDATRTDNISRAVAALIAAAP